MSAAGTILSLQWTLLRRRYGGGVQTWLGLLLALVMFVGLAAGYGVGIAVAVYALAESGEVALAAFMLGLFYAGLLGLWVLTPLLSLQAGPEAFVDPEAYQLYPVPRRTLFLLTLVSAAVQPMAWPLYAALLPPTLVLLWAGAGPGRLLAPVLLTATGVAWSAAVSSGLVAMTRTRRIREWMAITGALLLAAAFMLPTLVGRFGGGADDLSDLLARWSEPEPGSAQPVARWLAALRWTPAGLGARWVLQEAPGWAAAPALLLAGTAGLALAYAAFRRSLGRPEATRSRKGVRRASWLTRLLDRASGATGALLLKEAAYMIRDPHLRLAILLPIVLWLFFVLSGEFGGAGALAFITFITLNAVAQSGTNLLGRDRTGFDAFLAAPLRGRQVLFAKALAHLFLFALQFAILAGLALAFGRVRGPWVALIGAAAAAAAFLLLAGGQWFSVTAPYPIDPRRRPSGPGGVSVLLLLVFELAVAVVLVAAVGLPYLVFGLPAAVAAAAAVALLGALVFGLAAERCGRLLEARRERVRHALLART